MSKILVIDDTPFWRDLAADALRLKGYEVITASDGRSGLALLDKSGTDLIVLDVEMPQMEGLSFLEQIRRLPAWKSLPVIMLTGEMHKEKILRAKQLGAAEYLLKAKFSLDALLDRVQKRLTGNQPQARQTTDPSGENKAAAQPFAPSRAGIKIPVLLTRDKCIERAQTVMQARTLPGNVTQLLSMVALPRTELSDIASLIVRDPILSARILQVANSPTYASKRGVVSAIPDAVRNIGRTAIRDIAGALGIFDAMPPSEPDGFNPIRCWQHSFAVATLCSRLAPEADAGTAYLIGLCHDLGEILFHSHFGEEYRQVIELQQSTGKRRFELEREMLGVTHGELVKIILRQLDLPSKIGLPISAFHETNVASTPSDPMAKVLQIAKLYATGIQLTSSEHSLVRPLSRAECKNALGLEVPPLPDSEQLRSEIYALTASLCSLSDVKDVKLLQSPFARKPVRICLVRDPLLSDFDPVTAAMQSLADVTVRDALPTAADMAGYAGLVILTCGNNVPGCTYDELQRVIAGTAGKPIPTIWLAGKPAQAPTSDPAQPSPILWPVCLSRLAEFVEKL